jgi:hypothetical protein
MPTSSSPWPASWPLCRSIDIESITHLRRLIEVNLGDPAASERELKALIAGANPG